MIIYFTIWYYNSNSERFKEKIKCCLSYLGLFIHEANSKMLLNKHDPPIFQISKFEVPLDAKFAVVYSFVVSACFEPDGKYFSFQNVTKDKLILSKRAINLDPAFLIILLFSSCKIQEVDPSLWIGPRVAGFLSLSKGFEPQILFHYACILILGYE